MSNKIISSGGFIPSSINTPLDLRTRVQSIEDIKNIESPFIGMIFYVIDEEEFYAECQCFNISTEIELPKGTIKKMIGRDLTFEESPIEI